MTASDGATIAYHVDDHSDPWKSPHTLFLLHSAMSSARRMFAFVPHFSRHFRVVRMDMRGHGSSPLPPAAAELSLRRLTLDLVELCDALGVQRAHFLGSAGGGYLAQHMAIHHPQRVHSILLFASKPGLKHSKAASWIPEIGRKGLRPFLAETIGDRFPPGTDARQIEWFLDEVARNDVAFVARFVTYMTTQYWMDDVGRIRCPALIVEPGDEPIGDVTDYAEMQRRIPGSERIVYAGGRHNLCDYLADRCAGDALAFLRRHFPAALA